MLNNISRENLWETNSRIAQWVRLSGSQEEREAFQYLRGLLDDYGLSTTWLEHPALISYPIEASLRVIGGGIDRTFTCLTHAFGASVEMMEAEVADMRAGAEADYASALALGKVVLVNGIATPTAVYRAEQSGAAGAIFVNDNHLHNMIVSTVWGTPTPESAQRLPKIPVVSIVRADGRDLRRGAGAGSIRARIHTNVFCGWRTTPILVGDLPGQESTDFVMLSGHLDSWDRGAMDNGSANATMLEVARVMADARNKLYRGFRIIFWSGHSHGRYSGSTWYADHYWEELYEHCVAHVNVDSTGARGATAYERFPAHLELADFGAKAIEEHTGQKAEPYRMPRAGDMSFNGIGIPALFMELSRVPDIGSKGSSVEGLDLDGMPWWWHTSEDTIDKVDPDVLELDTRIYSSAIWRLCSRPLLPMDFRPVMEELRRALSELQETAGRAFDLSLVLKRTEELSGLVGGMARRVEEARAPEEIRSLNAQMKALSRALIPLSYSQAGRFEPDPAWEMPCLPGLQPIRELVKLDPQSDVYKFLEARLVRERNAVLFALREAVGVLSNAPT